MTDSVFPNPELTADEIANQEAIKLNATINQTLEFAKQNTQLMFDRFWNNPNATPALMAKAYGANAAQLFLKLEIWQQTIQQIDPTYVPFVPPDNVIIAVNEDGTVSITPKI